MPLIHSGHKCTAETANNINVIAMLRLVCYNNLLSCFVLEMSTAYLAIRSVCCNMASNVRVISE
jgi:hypothetical protein